MKALSGEKLVLLATAAGLQIAKETPPEELQILSDFFILVGTVLLTVSDYNAFEKSGAKTSNKSIKNNTTF
ncbi:MAG: hypothetical protein FWH03_08525 [Firmicutes bacterium]|nr:hypothetical protein [Bacillota bacterium]